jgi:hypothetical protein
MTHQSRSIMPGNSDGKVEMRYVQTFHDGVRNSQHTHALQMRGPACCHAMQGMLSVLMAGRLAPEDNATGEQSRAAERTHRRPSKHKQKEEQRHFHAFLASHTQPTLYIVRSELVGQAVLKVIERSDNAPKVQVIDISHRSGMPYPLHTFAPPVLVDRTGIVQGSELFRLLSKPSTP